MRFYLTFVQIWHASKGRVQATLSTNESLGLTSFSTPEFGPEIKTSRKDLDGQTAITSIYDSFFSFPKAKSRYSGVAVYHDPCRSDRVQSGGGSRFSAGALQPKPPLSSSEHISKSHPVASELPLIGDDENGIKPPADLIDLDAEGRALASDFGLFVIINVHRPNDVSDARFVYKMSYSFILQAHTQKLIDDSDEGREVIILGAVQQRLQ
jgi:AP endonuclease-2